MDDNESALEIAFRCAEQDRQTQIGFVEAIGSTLFSRFERNTQVFRIDTSPIRKIPADENYDTVFRLF